MRLVYGKWKTRVWYVTPCIGMHSMNKSRAIGIWWLREDLISAISRANHELISGLMNVYVTDEEFVQLIKDKL